MKRLLSLIPFCVILTLVFSACTAPAAPQPSATVFAQAVAANTPVALPTNTALPPTATATHTATATNSPTATLTFTPTKTHTPTVTSSPTNTATPTHTATAIPSNTPTLTPTRVPPTRKPATPKPSYEIPPGEQGFLIQNLTGTPITVRAASVGGEPREFQIGVNGEAFMTTPAPMIVWGIVLGDGRFQSGGLAVIQPGQLKTVKIYKIPGGSCFQPECFEYFPPN